MLSNFDSTRCLCLDTAPDSGADVCIRGLTLLAPVGGGILYQDRLFSE